MTFTMPHARRSRTLPAAAVAAAALLAAGCANPLAPDPSDHPRLTPEATLRVIERFNAERYATPVEPTPAGPQAPLDPPPPPPAPPSRFATAQRVALSIEEARAAALRHNLDLRVALVNPLIAAQDLREEEARFEAVFRPRLSAVKTDNPTLNTTESNQQEFIAGGAAVSIPLRTGGRVEVDFQQSRSETDNPFVTLPTAYDNDLVFSISHPLLRGAGRRANTAFIRIAAIEEDIAEAQTKLEIIRQLAAVDRSYWRLFAARAELEVRQQQYELAAEQLARAQRRFAAGDVPEVEVLRAQSGLAERLEAIIIAENAVLRQQRELKRIINIPELDVGSTAMIETSTPPDPVRFEFDPEALTAAALAPGGRMEMLELELRLAQDAINIDFNRNQALPLLNLDYTYRISGLGATLRDSVDVLTQNDFESWTLGLVAEIPIGNEAAKARVQRAILQRLQRLSTRDARAQAIRQEVLDAIDQVEAAWQRILAARQAVIAATRTLQAEQRQNDVGLRTSTDVLDAAARLAEAQSAEIRGLADYQIALVDLAFATGTLLGAARVDWVPAVDEDAGAGY